MIELMALAVAPIVQGLVVNGLTSFAQRSPKDSPGIVSAAEATRSFALQTLDVEVFVNLLRDTDLSEGDSAFEGLDLDDLTRLISQPDMQVLVHELLTARILEQPQTTIDQIEKAFSSAARVATASAQVDRVANIGRAIFRTVDAVCQQLMDHLDKNDAGARANIQHLAGLSSSMAYLRSIDRHLAILTRAETADLSAWIRFEEVYRQYVLKQHGYLVLPDFDSELKVPVEELYVEAELTRNDNSHISTLEALRDHGRVIVTGSPGGGKSTLANVSAYRVALDGKRIPVIVNLRDYGPDHDSGLTILDHIEGALRLRTQSAVPDGWLESKLLSGTVFAIFDGLDELLDANRRRDIRDAVESFCDLYPAIDVLVTSRVVGYEQAPLSKKVFTSLNLGDLTEEGVGLYTDSWFKFASKETDPETQERRLAAFLRESESVSEIRRNPLMLSLMCVLYRGVNYIPENRLSLYEECAKLLFKKWDRSRGITLPLEMGADIDSAIMHLAYWMLTSGQAEEGVAEGQLIRTCVEYLVPRRFEDPEQAYGVAEEFVSFCRGRAWVLADAGLNENHETLYTFTHRTFLEYYAASQLARECGTPERMALKLVPYIATQQFDVVGQLCVQIANRNHVSGGDRLICALLDETSDDLGEKISVYSFVARVLRDHVAAPGVLRGITQRLLDLTLNFEEQGLDADEQSELWSAPNSGTPIGFLMATRQQNRSTVADTMEAILQQEIADFPNNPSSRADRAVVISGMARVVFSGDHSDQNYEEDYKFWGTWSSTQMSKVQPTRDFDPGRHWSMVTASLIEHCKWTSGTHIASLPILWEQPRHELQFARIATLPLVIGWLQGNFYHHILADGTQEWILRRLAEPGLDFYLPLQFDTEHSVDGGLEARFEGLSDEALPGAVLLFCMGYEASMKTVNGSAEGSFDGFLRGPKSRHVLKYLAQTNEASSLAERTTYCLCRRRYGEAVELSPEQLSLLDASPATRSLLRRWSLGKIDFFTRPDVVEYVGGSQGDE